MKPTIIYQDNELTIINKPAGIVSNSAESVLTPSLQDWINTNFDHPLAHDYNLRNGLVHRLDKDTSGVMVIAKTENALEYLKDQFKSRLVTKSYIALVHGKLVPKTGHISLPLARSFKDRQMYTVSIGGKISKTSYQVEFYFNELSDKKFQSKSYQGFSLVQLTPQTGRTHQLRVVLKHLNHPIVGDPKYAGKKRSKADASWCQRHFLHAATLSFSHPKSKVTVNYSAPLPADLSTSLKLLTSDGKPL